MEIATTTKRRFCKYIRKIRIMNFSMEKNAVITYISIKVNAQKFESVFPRAELTKIHKGHYR